MGRIFSEIGKTIGKTPLVRLKKMDNIVAKLESEELPLEDSLELFEKGIKLSKLCSKKLAEAEKKVDKLLTELSEGEGKLDAQV